MCIINDILDYSQLQAQKLKLIFKVSNLEEIVAEVLRLVSFSLRKKGIRFDLVLDTKDLKYITTNKNRLKQVLLNLLSNSVKFTYEGFIKLSVARVENDKFFSRCRIQGLAFNLMD
jgi:signal transduction histidine kinase